MYVIREDGGGARIEIGMSVAQPPRTEVRGIELRAADLPAGGQASIRRGNA